MKTYLHKFIGCCAEKNPISVTVLLQTAAVFSSRISLSFAAFNLPSTSLKQYVACCREASQQHDAATTTLRSRESVFSLVSGDWLMPNYAIFLGFLRSWNHLRLLIQRYLLIVFFNADFLCTRLKVVCTVSPMSALSLASWLAFLTSCPNSKYLSMPCSRQISISFLWLIVLYWRLLLL